MSKNNFVADADPDDEKIQEPLLGTAKTTAPIILFDTNRKSIEMNKIDENQTTARNVDTAGLIMGDWGRWQFRTVSIIFLTKIPAAWFMACVIFTAPDPWYGEYECDTTTILNNNYSQLINISYPDKIKPDGTYQTDFCRISLNNWNETDDHMEIRSCDSAKFNINKYTSVVTQYDLVCSRTILVAISQSFHLFGVLIGGIIATKLMEHWSPKTVMMVGMVSLLPCGVATGYAPWVWMHMILRSAAAACCAMSFTPGAAIMADTVGGRAKTIVNANFEQFWSVGVILLPAIGYFTNRWAQIYVTITLPALLIIVLWTWIPDSPRWHLSKNNIDIAQGIVEEAAKMNKTTDKIPENLTELLNQHSQAGHVSAKKLAPQDNWKHLLSIPGASIRIIMVMTSWSLLFTCYYGTLLNIRPLGREYIYVNTAIAGACEIIGGFIGFQIIMHCMQKWKVVGIFTIMSGILPCIVWFLPTQADGSHMLFDVMIISMINKMGISAAICVNTTCTADLFPLPHKKRVVFATTVVTRIVFLTAPLIGATIKYGDSVPLTFYGLLSVVAGVCTFRTNSIKNISSNLPTVIDVPKIWNTNADSYNSNTKV